MAQAATARKATTLTARTAVARTRSTRASGAPARARSTHARSAPRRTRAATPTPGRLVPVAVGRTAVAVGGLADSGVVLRLTRGRLWIGALAALLVGIVALNVIALSLNASSSKTAGAADALRRENSALRAKLAEELSNARLQKAASVLGLIVPEPGSIGYLRPGEGDAATAARRLRSGKLVAAPAYVPPETPPIAEPLESAAVEPAAAAPAVPATESEAEPAPAPAPSATPGAGGGTPATGGGVASP